jgi:hypothetical protein
MEPAEVVTLATPLLPGLAKRDIKIRKINK